MIDTCVRKGYQTLEPLLSRMLDYLLLLQLALESHQNVCL